MARHVGIVGCSAEGAALCYRTLCTEAPAAMGTHDHPEVTMHTLPLARYMEAVRADDWAGVAALMLRSARIVAAAGAEFAICPDNTIHQAWEHVVADSPIPWLHIAEVVADRADLDGRRRLGITGTRYLMEGPVYAGVLERRGIEWRVPPDADRARIDAIIFDELVNGVVSDRARSALANVVARLRQQGCDAVVLGCTELPLLDDGSLPLPALDSTRLLARAALRRALD